MKIAVVVLVVLFNVVLSSPVEDMGNYRLIRELEKNGESAEYVRGFRDAVTLQKRNVLDSVKNYMVSHGMQLTSAACLIACEATTAPATLGISSGVCAACCGLIGAFGK